MIPYCKRHPCVYLAVDKDICWYIESSRPFLSFYGQLSGLHLRPRVSGIISEDYPNVVDIWTFRSGLFVNFYSVGHLRRHNTVWRDGTYSYARNNKWPFMYRKLSWGRAYNFECFILKNDKINSKFKFSTV